MNDITPVHIIIIIIGVIAILAFFILDRWQRNKTKDEDEFVPDEALLSSDELPDLQKHEGVRHPVAMPNLQKDNNDGIQFSAELAAIREKEFDLLPDKDAESNELDIDDTPGRKIFSRNKDSNSDESIAQSESQDSAIPELIISMTVMSDNNLYFQGADLYRALIAEELEYGDLDIFHKYKEGGKIFSVANVLKPGTFSIAEIQDVETVGVVLFAQLPSAFSAYDTLTAIYSSANNIAESLGGVVKDEYRNKLSEQSFAQLEEQAREYDYNIQIIRKRKAN